MSDPNQRPGGGTMTYTIAEIEKKIAEAETVHPQEKGCKNREYLLLLKDIQTTHKVMEAIAIFCEEQGSPLAQSIAKTIREKQKKN